MSSSTEWLACGRCQSALGRLEPVLQRAAFAEDLQLRVLAHYLITKGGKRLRPALVFLGGSFGRWDGDRLLPAAAALELIHVASLYHDDVMDRATFRRNAPSVNAQWGNPLAALAGTFLMARAMTLLGELGGTPNQLAGEASVRLATGQLMEVENAYNLELSEEEHLEILSRKTATMFELPLRLGAYLSGASAAHTEALAAYGRYIGLAFQLVDDALDLTGSQDQLGKDPTADLREGVYSMAVLKVLQQPNGAGTTLKAILQQLTLSAEDVQRVKQILKGSDCVEAAMQVAGGYAARARMELEKLPMGKPRQSLESLAEFTLHRKS